MKVEIENKVGYINKKRKATIKDYKAEPGNFDKAVHAAFEYTKKWKEDMVVVPGNSYMNKVYHIARMTDDLTRYVPGVPPGGEVSVGLVKKSGEVFMAKASRGSVNERTEFGKLKSAVSYFHECGCENAGRMYNTSQVNVGTGVALPNGVDALRKQLRDGEKDVMFDGSIVSSLYAGSGRYLEVRFKPVISKLGTGTVVEFGDWLKSQTDYDWDVKRGGHGAFHFMARSRDNY